MATKLLLIDDVDSLGRSGDIVSVKPGFARNFLLPSGFAIIADKNALRKQARLQEERKKQAQVDKQESEGLAQQLEGLTISTVVKVDHEGHMYGSVSSTDIIHLLQEQASLVVEKKFIQLKHSLKETGVHTINLKLKEGVTSSFKLAIVSEESEREAAKAEKAATKE
jgi:large subunit ribosomal protein L9